MISNFSSININNMEDLWEIAVDKMQQKKGMSEWVPPREVCGDVRSKEE